MRRFTFSVIAAAAFLPTASGNGVLRWGFGARDAGAAGAFGGTRGDAIAALQVNPALLSSLENEWRLSLRYLDGAARFSRGGVTSRMQDAEGAYPDFALSWRPEGSRLTMGLGFSPVSALEAEWTYQDAPGGIGNISYGTLEHDSGFVALRLALAASWQVTDQLSLGLSAGVIRSEVDFNAPFIFQTNPALENAKVDLDLETDDWAPSFEFGALYRPSQDWTLGARLKLPVSLGNSGSARVDYSAQLPPLALTPASPLADYRARARVELPLTLGLGAAWQPDERWTLGTWIDWHRWSDSYDVFRVDLANGSNGEINGALGSGPSDRIPLDWRDRFVFSAGAAYELTDHWTLRGGYRFGESPIPENLVTPLNGAGMEQVLTLGASWQGEEWSLDLAYGYEFSPTFRVGESGYNNGEYSHSSLEASAHHFSLGIGRTF